MSKLKLFFLAQFPFFIIHLKLFILALLSFFNGDGCYSERLQTWLEKKHTGCMAQYFKQKGAKWMIVTYEISENGLIFQGVMTEEKRREKHECMQNPKWKYHWNFVEEVSLA